MKRLFTMAMLLLLAGGVAFAGGEAEETSGSQETVTLQYLTRLRAEEFGREVLNDVADRFEAENPGVEIQYIDVSYDDLRSQILLKAQAGTPPDISEPVLSWIPQLAGAGILEPIDNHLSDDELGNYIQSAIEDGTVDGVPYAVPFWHGPILLYANVDLMERAGLPDRGPRDIQEFEEWIDAISNLGQTESGEDIVGFSMRNVKVPNSGFWFVPWIWSWGGQLVGGNGDPALDSQGFRDALSFYQRLAENGHSPLGIDAPTSRIIFANGRAGFVFDGPWLRGMLPTMTDNPNIHDMYKVFMVPNGVNGEPWTIANPTSLVVLKDSSNKELAFRYVKYLTESPEVSELFVNQMGLLPTYMPFVESSEDLQSEFAQTFFTQMEYSRGVPWKDPRWPGLQEILSSAVSDAISGRDVDQIATDAQADFEDLIEQ